MFASGQNFQPFVCIASTGGKFSFQPFVLDMGFLFIHAHGGKGQGVPKLVRTADESALFRRLHHVGSVTGFGRLRHVPRRRLGIAPGGIAPCRFHMPAEGLESSSLSGGPAAASPLSVYMGMSVLPGMFPRRGCYQVLTGPRRASTPCASFICSTSSSKLT